MEIYARVRRAVARDFGLARKTVNKMLEYSLPPGYRRQAPVRRPKLGPWQGVIDAILAEDKQRPRKQRHTAKRIFERLKAEHAYRGGYTIVKDYVRQSRISSQEMFVPLSHAPGEAQADFGEAVVVIAGVEQTAHFMVFDLPHSDDCFVQAFPAETTEAFLEGHARAIQYFGAVPTRILYDNTTLAVARILGDGERQKTRAFSELQSNYLFAEKFGRPGKGNDKGKVENLVGYARRNFMVPIPRASSWKELNARRSLDPGQSPRAPASPNDRNRSAYPPVLLPAASKPGSTTRQRPPPSRTSIARLSFADAGQFASTGGDICTATNLGASASRSLFFQAKNCPLFRPRSRQKTATL